MSKQIIIYIDQEVCMLASFVKLNDLLPFQFAYFKRGYNMLCGLLCLMLCMCCLPVSSLVAQASFTDTISLNGTWKFRTDMYNMGTEEKWYQPTVSTEKWDEMVVPGSWDTHNEYAYYTGDAWYQVSFNLPEKVNQKHIRLVFESVFNYAEVWLNGSKIGDNELGFLAFHFDINKYLKFGNENILVLKVNNTFKRGAMWNWGGIRRPVWLEITNPIRINHIAIEAMPNLLKGTATVSFATEIANYSGADFPVSYDAYIYYNGKQVGQLEKQLLNKINTGNSIKTNAKILLPKSKVYLWHFEKPELYQVEINVYQNDVKVHCLKDQFGIRKIEVDGFKLKLNGEEIRTVGFNIVPEDRVYGNSMPLERFKTMVDLMKECGANMARLSHVALPDSYLDYLDEKGIMTFEEVSLWGKDTLVNPNHPLPKLWLTKLIRQQYNHPSVIGWSVGNEIGIYKNNPLVYEYIKSAIALAKQLDPNRLVTYASHSAPSQPNDPAALCDIIFLNKYDNWGKAADLVHKNFPTKLIFISEFGADLNDENLDQSFIPIEKMLESMRGRPYVVGASLWTFNDYRSNYWSAKNTWATPPSENRTWGIVNSVLQTKRSYYDVKRAFQPFVVNKFSAEANGQVLNGVLSIESRGMQSFPSYTIDGYSFQVTSNTKDGKSHISNKWQIPALQPSEKSPPLSFALQIDTGIQSISFAIIDKLGYHRFDTTIFLQKPEKPRLIGIFKDINSCRFVFAKEKSASAYYIKYGSSELLHISDMAILNKFITIKNLSADSTYRFQLVAQNNAGKSEGDIETLRLASNELPPIIWSVIPKQNGCFISFTSDALDYKYEVEYGRKSGEYEKRMLFGNKGGIMIPHLLSGKEYFLRMRRILQWGFASEWTNELRVIAK